jgi:hypothetical protein
VEWSHLARDGDKWQAVVNTVMRNFMTRSTPLAFYDFCTKSHIWSILLNWILIFVYV